MFKTQPLGTCECDLMGNRAFVDVNQVGAKMTGWALHLIADEACSWASSEETLPLAGELIRAIASSPPSW